jgi:hypothetical protein
MIAFPRRAAPVAAPASASRRPGRVGRVGRRRR